MVLRPRKFNFKNIFKRRFFRKALINQLQYGQYGVRILQPLRLSSRQIFRYKIFLKKAVKKSEKTMRKAWFNVFPFLPLSRKVEGSRMGKGTGKLAGWVADLPSGINLVELKNLRTGRADYYCNQVKHKLPVKSMTVRRHKHLIANTLNPSIKTRYIAFS